MRIGIYTQPPHFNYGGLLQVYALQTVLRRMGYDVVTFTPNPYKSVSWERVPFVYAKRIVKKLLGRKVVIRSEARYNKRYDIMQRNLSPFIERYIKTRVYSNIAELSPNDYDVLIVGSDQVWRPKYNCKHGMTIEHSFLDFSEGWPVRRIAYGASFGTDEWEYTEQQTEVCSRLIKLFDTVSVREKSAVKLCKEHLGVDALQVLDPVLLLDRKDFSDIIEERVTKAPSGDILSFFLDYSDEKEQLVQKVADRKGLVPFSGHSRIFCKNAPLQQKIQQSVEQCLRNFRDAKLVITDSFHGCILSVVFGKQFYLYGNVARGMARYESLFDMLGISDRYVKTAEDVLRMSDIDYRVLYNRLKEERTRSMDFLMKVLKG